MSKRYNHADVRFNNGNGALLCNRCSIIIDYGFDHEDKFRFCKKCEHYAYYYVRNLEEGSPDENDSRD